MKSPNYINFFRDILLEKTKKPSIYKGSSMEPLLSLPPRVKGSVGEKFCRQIMEQHGKIVQKASSTEWDLLVNGVKVEVKLSTAWNNIPGNFTFQQLRQNQSYEVVVFVGVNPEEIILKWCTKKELESNVFCFNKYKQHGGKNGKQDLFWCGFLPFMKPIEEFIHAR